MVSHVSITKDFDHTRSDWFHARVGQKLVAPMVHQVAINARSHRAQISTSALIREHALHVLLVDRRRRQVQGKAVHDKRRNRRFLCIIERIILDAFLSRNRA